LYNYQYFNPGDINSNFVSGTFGSREQYNSLSQSQSITIHHLQDIASVYYETPYLFISAGSGGGSGFMYLKLDYSNLWSTLCNKRTLKILLKN